MSNKNLLIITSVLGLLVFILFFIITIPVLNFFYKEEFELIEEPLPEDVSVHELYYIADCGSDFSCFLDFARECEQVNAETEEGVIIDVIGKGEEGCFLYKEEEESALCIVPMEEFFSMLDEWEEEGDFLPQSINEEWCEYSHFEWERSALKNIE